MEVYSCDYFPEQNFCSNIDKAEALGQLFSGSRAGIIKYDELEARTLQLANQFLVTTNAVQPLNSSLNLDFTLRELQQAIQKARNSAPRPQLLVHEKNEKYFHEKNK